MNKAQIKADLRRCAVELDPSEDMPLEAFRVAARAHDKGHVFTNGMCGMPVNPSIDQWFFLLVAEAL